MKQNANILSKINILALKLFHKIVGKIYSQIVIIYEINGFEVIADY